MIPQSHAALHTVSGLRIPVTSLAEWPGVRWTKGL